MTPNFFTSVTERLDSTLQTTASVISKYRFPIAALMAISMLVLPFVVVPSITIVVTLVFTYAILAFSAIVPVGYTGQLVLCQGAFFGIGAYTYVLLSDGGLVTWLVIPVGTVIGAVVAFAFGLSVIRTSGVYLAIATLAFNELFVMALNLFSDVFGGSQGMATPELWFPTALLNVVETEVLYYYIIGLAFVVVYLAMRVPLYSQVGDRFRAIRENKETAESVGINTRNYRVLAFTLAGAVAAFAGTLYAPMNGYISPPVFNLDTSINVLLIAAVGGLAKPAGALVGALFVILLPEYLRIATEFRLLIYGILIILLFVYLPGGVVGVVQNRLDREEEP
ncbi:branched-chain amino acid ABC transporter permease [Halovenus marina]|uniref:branched-chain amino acid ABC transporter permease n=1 Tax=Halovenus marina TaxID=3396621 RepID=UPI003F57305B